MSAVNSYIILTSNVLGSFADPFEFDGKYGSSMDTIRQVVFEQVVSQESLIRNLPYEEVRFLLNDPSASEETARIYQESLIEEARLHDQGHGPTLSEIVSPDLLQKLREKQSFLERQEFSMEDLENFTKFVEKYKDKKIFHFLRNNPNELLGLDKALRDQAARDGKDLELSILSSSYPLQGKNIQELKADLIEQLFSKETFNLTKSEEILRSSLAKLDPQFLEKYLGIGAENRDLEGFSTCGGQILFYWLYQSLNFHLIAQDSQMIDEVNRVKDLFSKTLGNSSARAKLLKENIDAGQFGVVFTQECNAVVKTVLAETFWPVDQQNDCDGTFVFLRQDLWEPNYQVLDIPPYSAKGKINCVLATSRSTGENFLLASCHGNSSNAEDGRLQLALVMKRFQEEKHRDSKLQLIIGADANTKSLEDVLLLRRDLDCLGLTATSVGPTTVKKRMVTVQHSKAGRSAIDEEDFLITLTPESGGRYQFTYATVGFSSDKPDPSESLPNMKNPSDHYAVGACLEVVKQ